MVIDASKTATSTPKKRQAEDKLLQETSSRTKNVHFFRPVSGSRVSSSTHVSPHSAHRAKKPPEKVPYDGEEDGEEGRFKKEGRWAGRKKSKMKSIKRPFTGPADSD